MKKGQTQLSYKDRVSISVYIKEGLSNNEIGRRLCRNASSISREIKQNKAGPRRDQYNPDIAHDLSVIRKRIAARENPRKSPAVWKYVEDKLKEGWTPELISGRISLEHTELSVSHEAIYQYVYKHELKLAGYLPSRRLFRRPKGPRRPKQSPIPNRISIENRPEPANLREEPGHWESDSVVCGKSKESLNVMVERKSRFVAISKIRDLTSRETCRAIVARLAEMEDALRRSITYDNGFENRMHEHINEELGTQSYFCSPYHSWEKGSVEQVNMLIRRYIPKKMDLSKVTDEQIRYVENQLNNRPRKCLGYRTPNEVFNTFS